MNNTLLVAIGFTFIFVMTTAGSAVVYLFKNDVSQKAHSLLLGFAGGIMIAASVWSLLIPSISMSETVYGKWSWIPASIGFVAGGIFLSLLDKVIPHFHSGINQEEGPHVNIAKSIKLFLAVTLHNIPEGLAVGFAFGGAAVMGETSAFVAALGLSIGIGIQNFPEGAAIALPMFKVTNSRRKSFLYGMSSGAVEPISAILGFFLSSHLASLQPWFLAFSAGAMIFVVAEDLIPDANLKDNPHSGTWGVMAGFVLMMILDVALG